MRYVEASSFLLVLISSIAIHRRCCGSSKHKDKEDSDELMDSASAAALVPNIFQSVERKRGSEGRHRRREATEEGGEEPAELRPPKVEKLSEREIIQKILLNNEYDWRVRPVGLNSSYGDTGGPVKVTVNIYLRSISKIDDVNMEYSAQFTFRETWIDRRLAYERMKNATNSVPLFIVLALSDTSQQIWMPDTFFQNEKEARKHLIDKPNVLIRIYPSGEILYSVRLSMVLSCPMSLEYYPLDEQRCLIELASYAYTTDDIVYEWKNDTPVQQKDGLGRSLPSFELQAVKTGYCTSTTNTGSYSCLSTTLILRREYSYYLIQLYIPSFMLVVVSWVNFWIDKDSVPARVSLGVTTLLTMTTQASGVNAKLPPVSYTKAIDVWIGVCLAFIFGALLEFALVNYAGRVEFMEKERKKQKKVVNTTTTVPTAINFHPCPQLPPAPAPPSVHYTSLMAPSANAVYLDVVCPQCDAEREERSLGLMRSVNAGSIPKRVSPVRRICVAASPRRTMNWCRAYLSRHKERSKRIDVISRLVFPAGFFFFNCIYWCAYMIS